MVRRLRLGARVAILSVLRGEEGWSDWWHLI